MCVAWCGWGSAARRRPERACRDGACKRPSRMATTNPDAFAGECYGASARHPARSWWPAGLLFEVFEMLSAIRGFFDRLSLNARLVLVVSVVVLGLFGLRDECAAKSRRSDGRAPEPVAQPDRVGRVGGCRVPRARGQGRVQRGGGAEARARPDP